MERGCFTRGWGFGIKNVAINRSGDSKMYEITQTRVQQTVAKFLQEQLAKKLEPEEKALEKLDPAQDRDKVDKKQEAISRLKERFKLDSWMKDAAERMATQLKFGTHISKGVHPDSRGDNLNFQSTEALPEGLVGSQTLKELPLDANGNAAALPLAAFFETWVDEKQGIKLRHLIQDKHPSLHGVFASSEETSKTYATAFKEALDSEVEAPTTYERNKQLLWPLEGAMENDSYVTLIPLYPSGLTSTFFNKLNGIRYSEENKLAKENRKKKNVEQQAYASIPDIGITRLGGTKPQNISQLTSKQSGRAYLLQSLPPVDFQKKLFRIRESQTSLFDKRLTNFLREDLNKLYEVVEENKNTVEVRDKRKAILDSALSQLLVLAEHIQTIYSPGWSKTYQLSMSEKYWLDPKRENLEDEEEFAESRQTADWQEDICHRFAQWLNERLQQRFPDQAIDFGDAEFREWLREMEDAIKASQRSGKGVFV